jgi:hypothetical protein
MLPMYDAGTSYYNPQDNLVTTPGGFMNTNKAQINPFTKSGEYTDAFQYLKDTADPFNKERSSYITQLRNLMANPASVANNGAYKWSFDQGNKALMAQQAAGGKRLSGRGALEAIEYGQGQASQQFFKLADLLAGLSGGTQNPVYGAQAQLGFYDKLVGERQGIRNSAPPLLPHRSASMQFGGAWA